MRCIKNKKPAHNSMCGADNVCCFSLVCPGINYKL